MVVRSRLELTTIRSKAHTADDPEDGSMLKADDRCQTVAEQNGEVKHRPARKGPP